MNRLRQVSLPVLAAVCLAGLPACGSDDVEREANQAGKKADKAAKKAEDKAKQAKKDVDGY